MMALDFVILAIVLVSALIGLVRGLVTEILSLVGWVTAFIVAIYFSPALGAELPLDWGGETLRRGIAFLILLILVLIGAGLIRWFIAKLIDTTGLSGTDRFLGFLFGLARGALLVLVALILVEPIFVEAGWWREAMLPPEFLAFQDEVRELFGQAVEAVDPVKLK